MDNDDELVAHFRYRTHFAYVFKHVGSDRLHCIKYGKRGIIWDHFDNNDLEKCKEYMINDLPDCSWRFVEDSE